MKKILIALAVLLAVQVADAQVKTPDAAKKALDKAVVASQDAKKATKVATWLKLATSYMDAYAAPAGAAWIGATKQDLALVMPGVQPLETVQADLGGEACVKDVYEDKEFYYNQMGQIVLIYITKPVVEDALWNARNAYVKAHEADVKQSKTKDITAGLSNIAKKLFEDGMNEYTLGNLEASCALLVKAAEVSAAVKEPEAPKAEEKPVVPEKTVKPAEHENKEAAEEKPAEGGKYVCSICGYEYDGAVSFEELPEDYKCPVCKQPKAVFVKKN